jgi:hypothetical protein
LKDLIDVKKNEWKVEFKDWWTRAKSYSLLKIWLKSNVSTLLKLQSNDYSSNPLLFQHVLFYKHSHCRQRAPVENVLSASGTSHLGMIDIQATTKSKYYDHIVLLYLESRRCRHLSIIFVCCYLYVTVVNFIDYSDMDKMMYINNDKC